MVTKRLFDENAYLREFSSRVITCEKGKRGYEIVLEATAFFPEGGGQAADKGTLNGIPVLDVQEREGVIVHTLPEAVNAKCLVQGVIDWPHRFSLMQQHSGEHLVSGIIHARYGCNNVGFHMGRDAITIDFDGIIPPEDLQFLEYAANRAIWQNIKTEITYPTRQALAEIDYRSKKEISGQVRLVGFPGVDLCACCGTHVSRTGEIGIIKLLSCVRFREGVRMELLCGEAAYAYLTAAEAQNRRISGLLSAKPMETARAVERVIAEREDARYRLTALERQTLQNIAKAYDGVGDCLLILDSMEPDSVRRLTDLVMQSCGGRAAVFAGTDGSYHYAIGEEKGNLRSFAQELNGRLQGRGGGKPGFVMGSVSCKREEILAFFAEFDVFQQDT